MKIAERRDYTTWQAFFIPAYLPYNKTKTLLGKWYYPRHLFQDLWPISHGLSSACFLSGSSRQLSCVWVYRLGSDLPKEEAFDIRVTRHLTRSHSKKKYLHPESAGQYRHICQKVAFDYFLSHGRGHACRSVRIMQQTHSFCAWAGWLHRYKPYWAGHTKERGTSGCILFESERHLWEHHNKPSWKWISCGGNQRNIPPQMGNWNFFLHTQTHDSRGEFPVSPISHGWSSACFLHGNSPRLSCVWVCRKKFQFPSFFTMQSNKSTVRQMAWSTPFAPGFISEWYFIPIFRLFIRFSKFLTNWHWFMGQERAFTAC